MSSSESMPRHPIRVVAQRTGLTPPTIRAWERRYSAVSPVRSAGGQRLYSDRDVARLRVLRTLTEGGRSIGTVASLSDEEAEALLEEDLDAVPTFAGDRGPDPSAVVDEAYARILELDEDGLARALWRGPLELGARRFLSAVVAPLLTRIGAGWESGEVSPGQEHLASDVIDRALAAMAEPASSAAGPRLVVATLPGERHGLGARLAAATAAVDGWSVTYLGTDLPVADIGAVAARLSAAAVAVSIVQRDHADQALEQLILLRGLLDSSVALLVGGAGAARLNEARLPTDLVVILGIEDLPPPTPPAA